MGLLAFVAAPLVCASAPGPSAPSAGGNAPQPSFTVSAIGRIEKQAGTTQIRLDPRYRKGLLGIGQWSHLWVLYWFDRNDTPENRAMLQIRPRGNPENPVTGVFATRSPVRPNLIALSLCRVRSVQGDVIEIEGIDAFDRTPVLDLKPYAKVLDSPKTEWSEPEWSPTKDGAKGR
ncbi:MAG: tRNA (N6-threonylcarbamoyladenosine(37)-N6)-methyltransferase TrmO [Verrucomicrobia bacterium]|nr:tRNA (N6-threonylcarbamoyladenosine(37)-N6)-methyltransferase TrmO [Verrucomicrobiota bacterium]